MTILGLDGILWENEQTDKMDYRLFRRKYLLGCLGEAGGGLKAAAGKRATALLSHFISFYLNLSTQFFVTFCFFQPESCFP